MLRGELDADGHGATDVDLVELARALEDAQRDDAGQAGTAGL